MPLFREFHDRVIVDFASTFDGEARDVVEIGREAIYYGAEGLYLHQLLNFSRNRYREDTEWLLRNVGISIRPILDITKLVPHTNVCTIRPARDRPMAITTAPPRVFDAPRAWIPRCFLGPPRSPEPIPQRPQASLFMLAIGRPIGTRHRFLHVADSMAVYPLLAPGPCTDS